MKLSEKIVESCRKKIVELRKRMTQEEPASLCNVSRQSISKWEMRRKRNLYAANVVKWASLTHR